MKLKKAAFLPLLLLLCQSLHAGGDFGMWNHLMAVKSFSSSGAYLFARYEHRSFESASSTECFFLSAGGGYVFNRYFKADISYEYWDIIGGTHSHKAVLMANGTLPVGDWAFSLREKWELALNPATNACTNTLRSRIRAQRRFDGAVVFTPYVQVEPFVSLDGGGWIRNLYYAGCEFTFATHHSIDLYYMYHEWNADASKAMCSILGLGYTFLF